MLGGNAEDASPSSSVKKADGLSVNPWLGYNTFASNKGDGEVRFSEEFRNLQNHFEFLHKNHGDCTSNPSAMTSKQE